MNEVSNLAVCCHGVLSKVAMVNFLEITSIEVQEVSCIKLLGLEEVQGMWVFVYQIKSPFCHNPIFKWATLAQLEPGSWLKVNFQHFQELNDSARRA